jgi:cell division protein FtsB
MRILPTREEGFRAVMDQGPKAEAAAARWVEFTRPVWSWFAFEWRRLGAVAIVVIVLGTLLHAMFGANGMIVYRQKKGELQSLQKEVDRLQKENERYESQIQSLNSDPATIEKEAREVLHYARPGEYIYVSPDPPAKPNTTRARK